ncbi:MAG: hypothetical protein M1383_03575 [Patescibacteria group bacterium]|nr:hypothetical protein [Patescibacteria group bacterium]
MLETKEQKQYFAAAMVLVVILTAVSLWKRPNLSYHDTTNYNQNQQAQLDPAVYLKYLDSLKIDPNASKALFQEILTQKDVQEEVEQALQTDQVITTPAIPALNLADSGNDSQQAMIGYLTDTVGPIADFNGKTAGLNNSLFGGDPGVADQVKDEYNAVFQKISQAAVPKDAEDLQKSLLTAYAAYGELLEISKQYSSQQDQNPWPKVYRDYAVINDSAKNFSSELKKISDKYQLASLTIHYQSYAQDNAKDSKFALIPTANAFLGLGDVSITVGDIPRMVMDAVQQGLQSSFSQFMASFIGKLVDKIEQNYLIANFLYYSDALVSGQYVDDYLNKYVSENLDRQIIKEFIPQFSCGQQNRDLQPVFQAKAAQYLGFNPASMDPKDPNYYEKMARVGDFLASPNGWALYYQDLASQAESAAEKAAEQELTSPGLKTPRDTLKNSISVSINNIVSAQRAGLNAIMQLGVNNAKDFISKFVAQVTETMVNKFVFRGAVAQNGSLGVLKEQSTCLAAAQLQVVLPAASTQYQEPPPAPSAEDLTLDEEVRQCISHWDDLSYSDRLTCVKKFDKKQAKCGQIASSDALCRQLQDFQSTVNSSSPRGY